MASVATQLKIDNNSTNNAFGPKLKTPKIDAGKSEIITRIIIRFVSVFSLT